MGQWDKVGTKTAILNSSPSKATFNQTSLADPGFDSAWHNFGRCTLLYDNNLSCPFELGSKIHFHFPFPH